MPRPRMPVRIRGVDYENAHVAAAAIGVHVQTIYRSITIGYTEMVGDGRATPVEIAGRRFSSKTELAHFVGMDVRDVRRALKAGKNARKRLEEKVAKITGNEP